MCLVYMTAYFSVQCLAHRYLSVEKRWKERCKRGGDKMAKRDANRKMQTEIHTYSLRRTLFIDRFLTHTHTHT